ncbi:MAG: M1 family aminopeptidase [Bacteroidetes bacterium]|nr:M1 family aminopeptidase [Bacteroidota bacterium]
MKNIVILICLIISGMLNAQVIFNASDLSNIVKAEREAHTAKISPKHIEAASNYDVKWYRCCWNIDPAVKEISGNVTTLFTPEAAGLDSLVFDLATALFVDSVIYHHHAVAWNHASDLLTILFPSVIPLQTVDSVTVYYHGVPPENGFGSFVRSTHSGTPVIWTLSEPYGSSDWWPCKNGLTDKADSVDIFIRTPVACKAASNGLLISELPVGGNTLFHWKHRYPIASYLVCLGVTNYARYSHLVPFNSDTLQVVNYVYPEDSLSAASQTGMIVPMIQLFDSLFGLYPFQREKYGHAQFGWGGGMEHQTMTFVSSFGFELLAHELAHQWFGDKITCGSWTDIWLNEGFATYLSGLSYEFLEPMYWKRFREVRVQSIVSQPGGSVYCDDTTSVSRIFDGRLSYSKGAMVLHQLRWLLGDSVFFAAIGNYISDVGLAYGFARTNNLVSHLESSCDCDLAGYFDEWFTGEGYPSYHISWAGAGETITLMVKQTQSHASVPFFRMTIPIRFKNALQDTTIRFSNTFSGQVFTAMVPFSVDSVIFDPDCQLISGGNTISAVAELDLHDAWRIYPNPASDLVTLRHEQSLAKDERKICVYDHSGRLMTEQLLPPGITETNINTSKYPAGLYFCVFSGHDMLHTGKFIIIR